MNKDEIILNTYEEANYPSLEKLFLLLKKKKIDVTRKDVKLFLDSQVEQQLTTTQQVTKSSGHITALSVNECWQVDIFNLQKYSYDNKNFEYIFAVVDVFSRRAWAVATKNKEADTITKFHQSGDKLHPTQKPLELCEWLIKTYSNEDDNILDFCMGSGTTVIACINNKRNYIGIEMDNDIFKTAEKRINNNIN